MADHLTVDEFAKRVKEKYPDYAALDNRDLAQKMIAKYPEYKDVIVFAPTVKIDPKNLVASPPQESTLGSRAREAAIGVLSPFTIPALAETAKTIGGAAYDVAKQVTLPGIAKVVSGDTSDLQKTAGELKDLASGFFHSAVDPLRDYVKSVGAGDWDAASLASGQILSQTAPAVAGAVDTVRGALPDVGKLRETARNVAQSKVAPAATRTTLEKFGTDTEAAKAAQVASDAAIAKKNLEARQAAQQKNTEGQLQYDLKTKAAAEEAARKTAEAQAAAAAQTAENKGKTAAQIEQNRLTQESNARAEAITRSVKEGAGVLGERTKNLDALLREEGNGKYQAVRDAVKDDPGVPLQDLAEAARHAEENILKGSQESIKQLRELARKAPEDEGVVTGGVTFPPGSNLFEMLKAQGALEGGGNISFGDLQGYSSEIGAKLAKGGLPGDVYQALKYLKDKIDTAKSTIADRNGAGGVLRNADSFWRDYMDLLYDKDSALAKVRESVGTLDPEFYAEAFTKGKAGDVAIGKLKSLKSVYAKEAAAVADLARNLRSAGTELEGISTGKVKPVEPPKTVTAAAVAPKEVAPPSPVPTETTPQKAIPQPNAPTVEDLAKAKRAEATRTAENLGRLRPYDVAILAGSPLGLLLPTWGKVVGLAAEAARFGVPMAMKSDAFLDFISKPTARDLALIEKLPDPALAELKSNLRAEIAKRSKAGQSRLAVSPAVQRLISSTGTASGGVKSRRDALQVLGQPTP